MTTLLGRGTANDFFALVDANTDITKGEYLVSPPNGYAKPAYEAANLVILGRAAQTVANSGGAAGAKRVKVESAREIPLSLFENDTLAPVLQANVYGLVYLKDAVTVSADSAGGTRTAVRCWALDANGLVACEVI